MPSGKRCICTPKRTHERVKVRKGNFSRWQKPAGEFHRSKWSLIVCSRCGHFWRSMAKWVDDAPDFNSNDASIDASLELTEAEIQGFTATKED